MLPLPFLRTGAAETSMNSLTGSKNSEETSSEGEPEVRIQMGMDPYSFI